MGSEVECEIWIGGEVSLGLWLPGGLETSVDSGSVLGAGEGLEGSDSGAGEGSGFCTGDVTVGRAPPTVSSGWRLGLTLGSGGREGNSVSREGGREFVGVAGAEEIWGLVGDWGGAVG